MLGLPQHVLVMGPKRGLEKGESGPVKKASLAQGPIRWEHCFAADFGPQWHLAYTSDEIQKSAQRNQWIEELMGREENEGEKTARGEFNYLNFISFLKFNFKVFESVVRSSWLGPAVPPVRLSGGGTGGLKAGIKQEDAGSKGVTGESAFLILNGSIRVPVDAARPFIVGRWTGGDHIAAPDLNVKNIAHSAVSVAPRHCAIVHGSLVPGRVDRSLWYIVNYTKDGLWAANTQCRLNEYVALSQGTKIMIGPEIFLRFFLA